jgi:hypothetical protein
MGTELLRVRWYDLAGRYEKPSFEVPDARTVTTEKLAR